MIYMKLFLVSPKQILQPEMLQYCSCVTDVTFHRHILLQANTGTGKFDTTILQQDVLFFMSRDRSFFPGGHVVKFHNFSLNFHFYT